MSLMNSGLSREQFGELQQFATRLRSGRYCLLPQATGACSGQIIEAHSVPRQDLRLIARASMVYSYNYLLTARIRNQDTRIPQLIGVGEASVFTGFCGFHDNQVFSPIENAPFAVNPQHVFLASYRSLCLTLFNQGIIVDKGPDLQAILAGDPQKSVELAERLRIAQFVLDILEREKGLYDTALLASDFTGIRYYVLEVDATPDFLCGETILPVFDFQGNSVQDIALTNLDRKYINLITTGNGKIVLSWFGNNPAAMRLINSLQALPDGQKLNAMTQLAFVFVKNLYIAPDWWDGLPSDARDDLIDRQVNMMFLGQNPLHTCLVPNGLPYTNRHIISSASQL